MPLSLTPSGARDADDVASAVRGALAAGGHRPAITLLAPSGRQEQSFTSLAQWTAKVAHWLALDLLLEPGDRLGLAGPPGWVPAAAALGAWWGGLIVVTGDHAHEADVVVAHVDAATQGVGDVVAWGFGFDGAPTSRDVDVFVEAVQSFPDDPPAPHGTAGSPALDDGSGVATQAALLHGLRQAPAETVGIAPDAPSWLLHAALRPLVTGRPTVLLAPGVDRDTAAGDQVRTWLD